MASNIIGSPQSNYLHHFPHLHVADLTPPFSMAPHYLRGKALESWQGNHGLPFPAPFNPSSLLHHVLAVTPSCWSHWSVCSQLFPGFLSLLLQEDSTHIIVPQMWSEKPSLPLPLLFWAPPIPRCTRPNSPSIINHKPYISTMKF